MKKILLILAVLVLFVPFGAAIFSQSGQGNDNIHVETATQHQNKKAVAMSWEVKAEQWAENLPNLVGGKAIMQIVLIFAVLSMVVWPLGCFFFTVDTSRKNPAPNVTKNLNFK